MLVEAERWKAQLAETVGRQVRRYRLERGLSVQKLADVCTEEYGLPIKRSVLANFEGGRRPTVSLMELLVLARVLRVPPVLLVFPVGAEQEIEVLKGQSVPAWDGLKWFTGESRFPAPLIPHGEVDGNTGLPEWYEDPEAGWKEGASPVALYREHSHLLLEWRRNRDKVHAILATSDPQLHQYRSEESPEAVDAHMVSLARQAQEILEDRIQDLRQNMRARDIEPPALPQDAAYIDSLEDQA